MSFTEAIVPLIIAATAVTALSRRINVYSAVTAGAADGLKIILRIFPSVLALLTAVYMLRASGALEALVSVLSPVLSFLGIPPETAPLVFIRPLSGSGALAAGSDIINELGPDSFVGRTAAVMLGSTETTFYTISVYFGAINIRDTRYAIPAAICADLAGFIAAGFTVHLLMY